MNSINIISSRIGATPPLTPRGQSYADLTKAGNSNSRSQSRRASTENVRELLSREEEAREAEFKRRLPEEIVDEAEEGGLGADGVDEKTPLLHEESGSPYDDVVSTSERSGFVAAVLATLRWIASTLAAPGVYLISCFCDENGKFSPVTVVRNFFRSSEDRRNAIVHEISALDEPEDHPRRRSLRGKATLRSMRSNASSMIKTEDDDSFDEKNDLSKSSSDEEVAPMRRSIRIKLNKEDGKPKGRRLRMTDEQSQTEDGEIPADLLKSPTSPSSMKTKYPRSIQPPRPLIPPRQPSYNNPKNTKHVRKTLILDLDETLIHSMAKGGRMSSGHMVEVRLTTSYGGTGLGPQHPILYYVHKRPFCDDFLRRVSKWYELVIFTASVQEYADPVIDWLEQTQKFFTRRYYRQDCTNRNGVYIKDLSKVEPDLGKVMIVDNSPMSYIFHEDNAIPIEGWINDPTDNHLLYLVPLLEAMQFVTDVRSLLALRMGESTA